MVLLARLLGRCLEELQHDRSSLHHRPRCSARRCAKSTGDGDACSRSRRRQREHRRACSRRRRARRRGRPRRSYAAACSSEYHVCGRTPPCDRGGGCRNRTPHLPVNGQMLYRRAILCVLARYEGARRSGRLVPSGEPERPRRREPARPSARSARLDCHSNPTF